MYIVIAILAFGVLITTHELGHFLAAKLCGVRVLEFAVGMGPALLKKQGKETLYSLRLLPLGGFCAMEGEDESSEDPRAFSNRPRPARLLILFAGAAMNFILGLALILVVFAGSEGFSAPVITGFMEGCPYEGEQGLQVGDELYKVNGQRIYFTGNFSSYVTRCEDGNVDLVVIRDGGKLRLENYHLVPAVEVTAEDGTTSLKYGFYFGETESGFLATLKYSWYCALDFVRMVYVGLSDLITGRASVRDMSGVVGIVGVINETGRSSPTLAAGLENVAFLVAFIAVNLTVMNLLPIPALDGGRIFGLVITWIIESLLHRKLNPKIEGYVHLTGLVLLMGLMALVMLNDILRLIR